MRSQKFTLKSVDDASASRIASEHPADWDMSGVFEKSYRKFLEATSVNADTAEISGDTLEFCEAETVPEKKGIRIFRLGGVAAAACIVAEILLLRSLNGAPDGRKTPDNIDIIPVVTRATEDVTAGQSAEMTEQAAVIVTAESTTFADNAEEHTTEADDVTDNEVPEETDSPEEVTEPEDVTEPQEEDVPEATNAAETGFTVNSGAYDGMGLVSGFNEIRYIPDHDIPEEKEVHGDDIDGYMVLSRNEKSGLTEMQLMKTDSGSLFFVSIFDYDKFKMGFEADSDTELEQLEIGGRPAILRRDDGGESDFVYLVYDDGCHVAMIMAEQKNYDEIISLAEIL